MLIDDHRDDELRNEIIQHYIGEANVCQAKVDKFGMKTPEGSIAFAEFQIWRRAVYQARDGDLSEVCLPYC